MFSSLTKWIDLLKASSIQLFALALAAAAFLSLHWLEIIELPEIWFLGTTALLLVCLTLASFGAVAEGLRALKIGSRSNRWLQRRQEAKELYAYIPHMTDEEKAILGYLLERNQKSLVGSSSGGEADTLVARGIIVMAVRSGQTFTHQHVPYIIPDHLWDVLIRSRDAFPIGISDEDGYPWRRHWTVGH